MPAVRAYRHVLCSSLALGQLTDRQIDLRMEGGMALFMMASPLIGERSSARRDTMEVLLVNGNRARPAWHAFIAMSDLFFFFRDGCGSQGPPRVWKADKAVPRSCFVSCIVTRVLCTILSEHVRGMSRCQIPTPDTRTVVNQPRRLEKLSVLCSEKSCPSIVIQYVVGTT